MICESCLANLQIAWQFKIQCESSDIKLRQYYINQQQKQFAHGFDAVHLTVKHDNYSIKCGDVFAQAVTEAHIPVSCLNTDIYWNV